MSKHHTSDYKLSAVKYYLKNDSTLKNTCKIFECSHKSLNRWLKRFLNIEGVSL